NGRRPLAPPCRRFALRSAGESQPFSRASFAATLRAALHGAKRLQGAQSAASTAARDLLFKRGMVRPNNPPSLTMRIYLTLLFLFAGLPASAMAGIDFT